MPTYCNGLMHAEKRKMAVLKNAQMFYCLKCFDIPGQTQCRRLTGFPSPAALMLSNSIGF